MASELFKLAEQRALFWDSHLNEAAKYPSLFIEGYYEIIKELCTGIVVANGWKALNHECMFAFLKHKKLGLDFDFLLELKDIRNAIDYRGIMVNYDLFKRNQLRIKLSIKELKSHLRNVITNQ